MTSPVPAPEFIPVDSSPRPVKETQATRQRATKPPEPFKEAKKQPTFSKKLVTESLLPIYGAIAMAVAVKSPIIGTTILENAESCATAWADLAEKNESVKRVLMSMMGTTAWTGVIIAHAPIAMAVMQTLSAPPKDVEEESSENG